MGLRSGTLCNKELALKLLKLPEDIKGLQEFLDQEINYQVLEKIF